MKKEYATKLSKEDLEQIRKELMREHPERYGGVEKMPPQKKENFFNKLRELDDGLKAIEKEEAHLRATGKRYRRWYNKLTLRGW